ncbi:putative tyrosyl-tRNA synthetase, cytoplasmic [Lasiosphaeria miniovina]|uniref:tyrosine--tRNA ligase n=1 Tax=Lasiosphaeria miniovina TaxID=1954250 RepID=A0AA40B5A8_9PEZI|nr:putative tyrosyl-tRNA synthetase, cytoplasmic [Lasiosphaeria miniovina]KAK0727950.1 putative tyrosyl-tRNA synthetase, cytoplasmic [Lasiosphaeria miniovina]
MAAPLPKRTLSDDDKYALMVSNVQEVIRGDIIRDILPVGPLKIYWGTATTGRPHAACFLPVIKIAQFLQAGCQVKILLADLHGFLDADNAPEGVLENRAQYSVASYQLSPAFSRDLLRPSKKVSVHDAVRASSEIVKSMGELVMADGIYPMMQLLDEQYLDIDAEAHLMNPMVPGLAGGKMSSSDIKSKIDLRDDAETIRKKVAKAHCNPRATEGNGILAFIQHALLPHSELLSADGKASIEVALKDQTEATTFHSFPKVVAVYESDSLAPQLAKKIVQDGLAKLTESIRRGFDADQEWQEIARPAYPDTPNKDTKKPIKEKPKKKSGVIVPVVDM